MHNSMKKIFSNLCKNICNQKRGIWLKNSLELKNTLEISVSEGFKDYLYIIQFTSLLCNLKKVKEGSLKTWLFTLIKDFWTFKHKSLQKSFNMIDFFFSS